MQAIEPYVQTKIVLYYTYGYILLLQAHLQEKLCNDQLVTVHLINSALIYSENVCCFTHIKFIKEKYFKVLTNGFTMWSIV